MRRRKRYWWEPAPPDWRWWIPVAIAVATALITVAMVLTRGG